MIIVNGHTTMDDHVFLNGTTFLCSSMAMVNYTVVRPCSTMVNLTTVKNRCVFTTVILHSDNSPMQHTANFNGCKNGNYQ